jgi:uncharacterized protein YecE (DUF72 family)
VQNGLVRRFASGESVWRRKASRAGREGGTARRLRFGFCSRPSVTSDIKVGLCGFTMAIGRYASHFPVVEVQQTFYEPPADAVMRRWYEAMPPGFEFTLKAWQLITHESKSPTYRRLKRPLSASERSTCGAFRDSAIVREALDRTLACAKLLRAKKVLFQSPASFRPSSENIARLRHFFSHIASVDRPADVRYFWEPRGPAWTEQAPLAAELCEELELGYVVDPFVNEVRAGSGVAYLRLHGISGARHVYTDAELKRLASMTPPNAYVLFNNIPRVGDAQRFLTLLASRG